jgi:hypothetical protein
MEAVEPSASQGDPSARLEWCAVVDERSRVGCLWTWQSRKGSEDGKSGVRCGTCDPHTEYRSPVRATRMMVCCKRFFWFGELHASSSSGFEAFFLFRLGYQHRARGRSRCVRLWQLG